MEFIYAVGRPGHLDFYIAANRADVPADAIIFAVCHAASLTENTDEDLFNAITDQEYFTVQGIIGEARIREAARG